MSEPTTRPIGELLQELLHAVQAGGHTAGNGAAIDPRLLGWSAAPGPREPENSHFSALPAAPSDAPPASDGLFRAGLLTELCARAWEQRVVIVPAVAGLPAEALLRAAARRLARYLQERSPDPAARPRVRLLERGPYEREAERDEPSFDLDLALRKLSGPSILLFPRATRPQLGWNLEALSRMPAPHPFYILACTEQDWQVWRPLSGEQPFWVDLPADGLFEPAALAALLHRHLLRNHIRLPAQLQGRLTLDGPWLGQRSIREVAAWLGTPTAVLAFLQTLYRLPAATTAEELRALVDEFGHADQGELIERWFYGRLTRREQLLALGAALLEGLREDQLFAALQELLERAWQQPEAGALLDYIDLEQILIFFELGEGAPGAARLTSRAAGLRTLLLEAALRSHRRHIQRALPWLAQVITRSHLAHAAPDDLFGTGPQRADLRVVLGASLSDLGLRAPDLAQPALLWLVAHEDSHGALARALARWYGQGQSDALLRQLRRWQTDPRQRALVQRLLAPDELADEDDTPEQRLQAVSLLTLSYTLRDTPPGAVEPELLDALLELARRPARRARQYLRDYTLPMLTARHTGQLGPLLQELAQQPDMRSMISTRLAMVYRTRPRDVTRLLQEWYEQGRRSLGPQADPERQGWAEALLATVALTLGSLPYESFYPIKLDVAREMQREVLNVVRRTEERTEVWTGCFYLASTDPTALQGLLRLVTDDDEDRIVEWLVKTFLEQRAQVPGEPDARMETPDGVFPIWFNRPAPETDVERTLHRALERSRDERLPRLAFRAFVGFVERFDVPEDRFTTVYYALRDSGELAEQPDELEEALEMPGASGQPLRPDFYRDRLVPRLVLLYDPPFYEDVLRDVMPIARELQAHRPHVLERLIQRLKRHPASDLAEIAERMLDLLVVEQQPTWRVLMRHPVDSLRAYSSLNSEQSPQRASVQRKT